MKNYKRPLLIGDLVIQSLLYIPTVIASLAAISDKGALIVSLSIQFCLGVYHVLGGIVGATLGRRWNIWYLLVVLVYFLGMGIGYIALDLIKVSTTWEVYLGIGYGIVVPLIIGGFYYIKTFDDLRKTPAQTTTARELGFDENILDAGI